MMKKHIINKIEKNKNIISRFFLMFMLSCFFTLASHGTSSAGTVALSWTPNTEDTLAGYKVYYKAGSSTFPFDGAEAIEGASPIDVHNQPNATISGLDPSKTYYFAVTAYDMSGVESPYSEIVTIPEWMPPTASITSPANNTAVNGTVSVVASASDNVGVSKVEFYLNGILQATETATPYVFSLNTTALSAGAYTLMAKAYDAAGNVGQSDNVAVTVVNDTTAPVVSFTAPGNNTTVSGTVAITASASDNVGVSRVEFYENGVLLYAGNVSPFSYNWNTTSVGNGIYTLLARVYDNAGNLGQSSTVSVTVLNDATPPAVTAFTMPTTASSTTVAVSSFTATDNTKVTGYLITESATAPEVGSAGWSTSAPVSFTFAGIGTRTAYAWAKDGANNISASMSATVGIALTDTIHPTVSIDSPSNNATVSGTVSVTASASDNIAVTKVVFYVNGALRSSSTAVPYSYSWNTTSLANGTYVLTAIAYDAAGNVGQSKNATITVFNDKTAPTVNTFSTLSSAYTLSVPISSFSATDNVGVTGYLITESAIAPSAGSVGWFASAPSGYTFTTTGTKTLYAWAKDAAGNVSAAKTATVVISIPKTVSQDVMVLDSSTTFPTIQDAYNTVPESGTIAAKDVTLSEQLNFNRAVNVNLEGGMDASFQSTTGTTAVSGVIKISKGKVVVSKIIIR